MNIVLDLEKRIKQLESSLEDSQELVSEYAQILEHMPVTVVITDLQGSITYVNPRFKEVTGYSASEVLGKNPRILKSEHTSSEEYSELWKTIAAGKTWHGEFQNRRKDNTLYWESASISPVFNAESIPVAYVAIKQDITEKKEFDENMRILVEARKVRDTKGLSGLIAYAKEKGIYVPEE